MHVSNQISFEVSLCLELFGLLEFFIKDLLEYV